MYFKLSYLIKNAIIQRLLLFWFLIWQNTRDDDDEVATQALRK